MSHIWRTEHLIYRAVDVDDEPFLSTLSADPTSYLNSCSFLPVPVPKTAAKGFREWLESSVVGCVICLPAAERTSILAKEGEAEAEGGGKPSSSTLAGAPTPIGTINLTATEPRQWHHRRSEVAITLHKDYQGRGYGTEAIAWILEWGFRWAGLHSIGIAAFEWNEGAIKLYRRLGFVHEGTRRDFLWYDGGYRNLVVFSMLEHEWRASKDAKAGTAGGGATAASGGMEGGKTTEE